MSYLSLCYIELLYSYGNLEFPVGLILCLMEFVASLVYIFTGYTLDENPCYSSMFEWCSFEMLYFDSTRCG